MEQRLERALITTTAFGFFAMAIVVGFSSAIECGLATAGCYLVTSLVQRRMPGRRVANAAWERRRLRELDENLSRRTPRKGAPRRPARERASMSISAPALFDADERIAEPSAQTGYGW